MFALGLWPWELDQRRTEAREICTFFQSSRNVVYWRINSPLDLRYVSSIRFGLW